MLTATLFWIIICDVAYIVARFLFIMDDKRLPGLQDGLMVNTSVDLNNNKSMKKIVLMGINITRTDAGSICLLNGQDSRYFERQGGWVD